MTIQDRDALRKAFERELDAQVDSEEIGRGGRYRFAVTSPRFVGVPHLKRQDALWKVVDQVLPREAALDISIILAFEPADLTSTHA